MNVQHQYQSLVLLLVFWSKEKNKMERKWKINNGTSINQTKH